MENQPLDHGKEQLELEQTIKACVASVLKTLNTYYDLELNNFEYLRLWKYAKEAIERDKKDKAAGVKVWHPSSISPEMETLEYFFTREFGMSVEDVHRIYELDMPGGAIWQLKNKIEAKEIKRVLNDKGHRVGMIKTSKVLKDFKQHLKILQEQRRRGEL